MDILSGFGTKKNTDKEQSVLACICGCVLFFLIQFNVII